VFSISTFFGEAIPQAIKAIKVVNTISVSSMIDFQTKTKTNTKKIQEGEIQKHIKRKTNT
jgi:hypothetical protein